MTLHYTTSHDTALHHTTPHHTALHYTTSPHISPGLRGPTTELRKHSRFQALEHLTSDRALSLHLLLHIHVHIYRYMYTHICIYICSILLSSTQCFDLCSSIDRLLPPSFVVHLQHVCMCICMYVRMYLCMYVCIYVSMYLCMDVRMHLCVNVGSSSMRASTLSMDGCLPACPPPCLHPCPA
jgi:hypothetical protein